MTLLRVATLIGMIMTPLCVATLIGMIMTPLRVATLIGMIMTPLCVATLIGMIMTPLCVAILLVRFHHSGADVNALVPVCSLMILYLSVVELCALLGLW